MEEDLNKVCRVCSHIRKHLRPLSEKVANFTYTDIIYKITNVKIVEDDHFPNKICTYCRTKAREGYEFSEMVERTDNELKRKAGLAQKRIKFNNIQDIKVEIDIKEVKIKREKIDDYSNIVCLDFLEDEDIVYNNTTIKKVHTDSSFDYDKTKDSQLSVGDFLNSFRADDDDIDYNDCDYVEPVQDSYSEQDSDDHGKYKPKRKKKKYNEDEDYVPGVTGSKAGPKKQYTHRKRDTCRTNSKRLTGEQKVLKTPIKPTVIKHNNLRLMACVYPRKKKTDSEKRIKKRELCPHCGLYVSSLRDHILQHTGKRNHKCDLCEKSFFTDASLKTHKKKHGEKTLQCPQCVGVFRDMFSLKKHMLSHTNIRNYICDICNKGFKLRNTMLRHVKGHSAANKTVKCELCSMSFYDHIGLKNHMRTHTGERPYKCELCNQPYSYKRDFDRHCFKKHGAFFKRRSEYVMNEEVLKREKVLMKQLYLRAQGIVKEGEPLNPFEGPNAAMSFHLAIEAIKDNVIPIESIIDS